MKIKKIRDGFNILSPYINIDNLHFMRVALGQVSPGCYAKVWLDQHYTFKYRHTFNYYDVWDDLEVAQQHLDNHLLEHGFILCDTIEQWEKYKVLL